MSYRPSRPLAALSCAALAAAALLGCKPKDSGSTAAADTATPALSVQLLKAEQRQWPDTLQANGSLSAWQEAVISAETGSYRIEALLVDVGAKVQRGQLMARLASDSLTASLRKQEATVAEAAAALKQAAAEAARARAVGDGGALSPQQIDEYLIAEESKRAALASAQADLVSTKLQLSQTRILAVDDGVVSSRSAELGNVISAGTEMFRLVRGGKVEWRAELDAQQLARVSVGQSADVVLPGGQHVQGRVRLVAPTLTSSTARGLAYVSLPADSGARAGSYASGTLMLSSRAAWTVPEAAITLSDGRSYVYTVDKDSKAHRQVVTTGRRRDGRVEIVQGVAPQQPVIASGGGFLNEGVRVKTLAAQPSAQPSAQPAASAPAGASKGG